MAFIIITGFSFFNATQFRDNKFYQMVLWLVE